MYFFVIVLPELGQIMLQAQIQLYLHAAANTDFGCSLIWSGDHCKKVHNFPISLNYLI